MLSIDMLPASYGDSLWVRYGDPPSPHNLLIDAGFRESADEIIRRLRDDVNTQIELMVLTHIDADHIEGAIHVLQDPVARRRIRGIWFNGWPQLKGMATDELGSKQGEYFSALIRKYRIPWNRPYRRRAIQVRSDLALPVVDLPGGMRLTVLSPTAERLAALRAYWVRDLKGKLDPGDEEAALSMLAEDGKYDAPDVMGAAPNVAALVAEAFNEDTAVANGSSIAFLAEYDGKRMLFTGDAFPSVLLESLQRMSSSSNPVDVLKVSHHGSRRNTSPDLLDAFKCRHALVSTDGKKFGHPDPQCIARIIDANRGDLTIHFNYGTIHNESWCDRALAHAEKYRFATGLNGALTLDLS